MRAGKGWIFQLIFFQEASPTLWIASIRAPLLANTSGVWLFGCEAVVRGERRNFLGFFPPLNLSCSGDERGDLERGGELSEWPGNHMRMSDI